MSHGCVGMSMSNAIWLFNQSTVGDVVKVDRFPALTWSRATATPMETCFMERLVWLAAPSRADRSVR